MEELLEEEKIAVDDAVAILRNKEGLDNKDIGFGNEKALNQLIAHHGIVFKPESGQVWVSSNPYQLGEFVAYDLNDIFADRDGNPSTTSLSDSDLNIPKDPFIQTQEYRDYEAYRVLEREVERALANKESIAHETLEALQRKNPEYWKAYYLTGKYYLQKKYNAAAKRLFELALTKEITTLPDRQRIEKHIEKLSK